MRPRGRARRPLTVFDALVLSSPLVLGLLLAGVAAVGDYTEARQFDDWWSRAVTLPKAFAGQVLAAARTPRAMTVRQRLDAAADDGVALRLRVSSAEWDAYVANAFASDNPWVDAEIVREGGAVDVRVRRRGDTSVHWTTPKTSFTLRAAKGERIRGFRDLALSGKEVLASHIANSVPAEFGVRTPFTAVTPVYLNERYYGLFRAVEPIDESYLRRQGWLPGNVYRADTAERGEYYKGLPRNVFNNPYIWDRVAEGTDTDAAALANLSRWLLDGALPGLDDHQRFMGRVDREATARLMASMLVVGDPYHMSGVHNHFWFEDPSTGLLTPLPWDLRLLNLTGPATNPLNRFFANAFRDPFLASDALRFVHDAVEDGLLERIETELHQTTQRFAPHLAFEDLRRELVSNPGDPDEIRRQLRENLATLDEWARDGRIGFLATDAGGHWILDFESAGFAGADLVGLRFEGADADDIRIYADRDLDGFRGPGDSPVTTAASGRVLSLDGPIELYAAWRHDDRRFSPGRVHYRLYVEGPGTLRGVTPILRNRVTGETVTHGALTGGAPLGDGAGFHPWAFDTPRGRMVRLSGAVRLPETLRLSEQDTLVIAAGTTITLDPDVSIIARGLVLAEGTAARPIEFVASRLDLPWGTLALQGGGADGSRLTHARFVRGGGGREGRIDYKGMVSIHRARDVRLTNVTFEDNMRSDDALNVVHAEVFVSGCIFRRANGDAIDYDYSEGTIERCTFEDARNDAIDLMTSSPLIRSNRILRSSDKGISIGESSHPLVVDNHIADGGRGIEIKDRSFPVILHNTIEGNEIGVLSGAKNWRYAAGGSGLLALSRVSGNVTELERDAVSTLSIIDSPVGTGPAPATGEPPLWVHAAHGLGSRASRPGALGQAARWTAPLEALWSVDFRSDDARFYDDAEGWDRAGRLRLRQGGGVLSVRIERGDVRWGRAVDWNLRGVAEFVVELTGRDLVGLRVVFTGAENEHSATVPVSDEPGRIGTITIDVPPGRYEYVRFEASVDKGAVVQNRTTGMLERRGGRVDIYRLRLFETGSQP